MTRPLGSAHERISALRERVCWGRQRAGAPIKVRMAELRPLSGCAPFSGQYASRRSCYKHSVAEKRADTILELMQFIERATLNRALTDLTDDELHWEPHRGAWGVRPRSRCTTATPIGDGDWVMDFDEPLVIEAYSGGAPEPMATIAWLISHIASVPGMLATRDFLGGDLRGGRDAPFMYQAVIFHDAEHAVSTLRDGWLALETALRDAADEALERPSVEYYGPSSGMQLTLGALNEVSHHGTQMCMLRDLFAHR